MLQLRHGVRIDHVILTVTAPLVVSTPIELGWTYRSLGVGKVMPQARLLRHDIDADAADL